MLEGSQVQNALHDFMIRAIQMFVFVKLELVNVELLGTPRKARRFGNEASLAELKPLHGFIIGFIKMIVFIQLSSNKCCIV